MAQRRRPTDVVEDVAAWILASVGVFLLVAAVLSGFAVHAAVSERSRVAHATLVPAEAVLVEDAPVVRVSDGGPVAVRVDAVWTGRDGLPSAGTVPVSSPATAGATVPIWLDRDGRAVPEPVGEAGAVFAGVVLGVVVLLVGGSVAWGCWVGVRWVTGRVNAVRWEREWERVGPEWSREVRP